MKSAKKSANNSVHASMKYALILPQIFGFFPLAGISNPNYKSLKFSWKSMKMLYALVTLNVTAFSSICQLYKMITVETNLTEISLLVFLICSVLASICFIKLAREWPLLIHEWHRVEVAMGNNGIRSSLKIQINIFLIVLTFGSMVDHLLLQITRLRISLQCSKTFSDGVRHFYVNMTFIHIFEAPLEYSVWKAIIFHISYIQINFCWTYGDTFIVLLSTAFVLRMAQIGYKIKILIKSKVITTAVWRGIREEYHLLSRLCLILDQKISYLVLLSFFSNLYFVLVQLFNSLRPKDDALEKIYFSFSFGFLILRIICVSLSAASVHDNNKRILNNLLAAPSKVYNSEVERLTAQIMQREISISGNNFFRITRGLLLKIAGAIVTYELVLIQFNKSLLESFQEKTLNAVNSKMSNNHSYWLC